MRVTTYLFFSSPSSSPFEVGWPFVLGPASAILFVRDLEPDGMGAALDDDEEDRVIVAV